MLKKNKPSITIILLFLFLMVFSSCEDNDTITVYEEAETVEIGALIPLSGDASNNGEPMLAALQIAEEELNQALQAGNSNKRIQLVYADTQSDGATSDILLKSFITQGLRFIIGPMTSNELLGIENTINNSNSLLISPSSTLSSLAVENDNIYRFVPDDTNMVNAIVEALWHEGIRNLALLYRNDAWGAALAGAVMDGFVNKGGTIIGSEAYTNLRQSIIEEKLGNLSALISNEIESVDASPIGFQLICFSEGDGIMETAAADPVLGQVRWFGSDGFVQTGIENFSEQAAQFAVQTEYMAPIFGLEPSSKGEALKAQIEIEIGSTVNIYALLSYDAFMVAANTLLAAGDELSLEELRNLFLSELDSYEGAVGMITLNAAGDWANGDYYFWSFVQENSEYLWKHILTYEGGQIIPY